jgi:hypothetical protein
MKPHEEWHGEFFANMFALNKSGPDFNSRIINRVGKLEEYQKEELNS